MSANRLYRTGILVPCAVAVRTDRPRGIRHSTSSKFHEMSAAKSSMNVDATAGSGAAKMPPPDKREKRRRSTEPKEQKSARKRKGQSVKI